MPVLDTMRVPNLARAGFSGAVLAGLTRRRDAAYRALTMVDTVRSWLQSGLAGAPRSTGDDDWALIDGPGRRHGC
jgi:hypothetical protein